MLNVDTPEKNEEGFQKAKQFTTDVILHKEITIQSNGFKRDSFGRYLATIYIPVENRILCLNQELLSLGLAKKYERKSNQKEE